MAGNYGGCRPCYHLLPPPTTVECGYVCDMVFVCLNGMRLYNHFLAEEPKKPTTTVRWWLPLSATILVVVLGIFLVLLAQVCVCVRCRNFMCTWIVGIITWNRRRHRRVWVAAT